MKREERSSVCVLVISGCLHVFVHVCVYVGAFVFPYAPHGFCCLIAMCFEGSSLMNYLWTVAIVCFHHILSIILLSSSDRAFCHILCLNVYICVCVGGCFERDSLRSSNYVSV